MKEHLENLLIDLELAYNKSDIKQNKFCLENNRKWGYWLIETSLKPKLPLIIGFNWGIDNSWSEYQKGIAYENQKNIAERGNMNEYKGFVKKVMNPLKEYFPQKEFPIISFEKTSHSNFCFFRSEREEQISENDISLCIPIFEKMIEIMNPSVVFCFSSKARDYLIEKKLIIEKRESIIKDKNKKNAKTCKVVVGILKNNIPIYCLPHPSYRLTKKVREEAWEIAKDKGFLNKIDEITL